MDTRTSIYFNLSCAEILFLRLCVVFFLPLTSPTAQIKHHVRMYVIRSGAIPILSSLSNISILERAEYNNTRWIMPRGVLACRWVLTRYIVDYTLLCIYVVV